MTVEMKNAFSDFLFGLPPLYYQREGIRRKGLAVLVASFALEAFSALRKVHV